MSLRIAIAGDCSTWNFNGKEEIKIPKQIKEKISSSDIFIFNLEGPIIKEGETINGPYNNRLISFLLSAIDKKQPTVYNNKYILEKLNICDNNVACLSNNHILDGGDNKVKSTITELSSGNFFHIGAGMDINEASKPLIIKENDTKISIVNYNFVGWRIMSRYFNIFGASQNTAGANYKNISDIRKEVQKLREVTDYVIAICHIGSELESKFSNNEMDILKSIPANRVIAHHPHVSLEIDSSNIYSCGDLFFKNPSLPNERKSNIIIDNIGGETIKKDFYLQSGLPHCK